MKNALSLGTFDGIHKGHRAVLNLPADCRKIAVTFEIPPKLAMSGDLQLIMTNEDKCRVLKSIGIDEILTLDFEKVRDIGALEFLELLYNKYKPSVISCGFNYRFGKGGEGNTETLKSFCTERGIDLLCSLPVEFEGETVSSTLLRNMLKNGEIEKANALLQEPFSFKAEVIDGEKRGRSIGFPTVNQKYPKELVTVKFGVYKTLVDFEGRKYQGITNIGLRPTFKSDYIISETYIKNFSDNLYGKVLRITPLSFLREEKKFSSIEELKKQIKADIEA